MTDKASPPRDMCVRPHAGGASTLPCELDNYLTHVMVETILAATMALIPTLAVLALRRSSGCINSSGNRRGEIHRHTCTFESSDTAGAGVFFYIRVVLVGTTSKKVGVNANRNSLRRSSGAASALPDEHNCRTSRAAQRGGGRPRVIP